MTLKSQPSIPACERSRVSSDFKGGRMVCFKNFLSLMSSLKLGHRHKICSKFDGLWTYTSSGDCNLAANDKFSLSRCTCQGLIRAGTNTIPPIGEL